MHNETVQSILPARKTHAVGAALGICIAVAMWRISTIPSNDPGAATWCFWFGAIAGVVVVLSFLDARSAWVAWRTER